jgi:hypothetical protein
MSRKQDLQPSAASLVMSLRDLGYSLETAIADIVDNSITAGAKKIDIICDLTLQHPALCIIDNGCGMDEKGLIAALKHGSKGPKAKRKANDLGRFGLGLKTASFSQGRTLTVAARQKGVLVAAEWDLDMVVKEDKWFVRVFDTKEIQTIPHIDQLPAKGTIVVWRKLDRLFEDEQGTHRENVVNEKLASVREHLSLVFHRFLEGDAPTGKIAITLNGHAIQPFDPFCRNNKATQKLPPEVVIVDGNRVNIQAFILPHHSRLSPNEYEFYKSRSDFISNQGAYVYRNYRLMAWGDWFKLVPKGEATKLGRVQIDFPSALDEAWTIDIKKSRAFPPRMVRDHLRQILQKITGAAVRVHRGRGQKLYRDTESPMWERYAEHGTIRYALNQSHPIVEGLLSQLNDVGKRNLKSFLVAVPAALPIDIIYTDFANEPKSFKQLDLNEEEVLEQLRNFKIALFTQEAFDAEQFIKIMSSTRLYDQQMVLVEKFARGVID